MLETWFLRTAVGGGLLLLIGWIVSSRFQQPARQQLLAEWTLLGALILAILNVGPGWISVPWDMVALHEQPSPNEVEGNGESLSSELNTVEPFPALVWETLAWIPDPDNVLGKELEPAAGQMEEEKENSENTRPEQGSSNFAGMIPGWLCSLSIVGWLILTYGCGAVVLLIRWLWGYVVLSRFLRGTMPPPAAIQHLFDAMIRGDRLKPHLRATPSSCVPLSCGLFRPTIVVPMQWCEAEDLTNLRWVLAHELTHLRRRDAWSFVLFGLGQAVYFYLPWFWSLRRRVRLCQEFIADAAVLREAAPAPDYAQFLLGLIGAPAVPVLAAGALGKSSDLFRRVTMLLDESVRVESRCPGRWSLGACVSLVVLVLALTLIGFKSPAAPVPGSDDGPSLVVLIDQDQDDGQDEKKAEKEKQSKGKKQKNKDADGSELKELRKAIERLGKVASDEDFHKAKEEIERRLKFVEEQFDIDELKGDLEDHAKVLEKLRKLRTLAQEDSKQEFNALKSLGEGNFKQWQSGWGMAGQGRLGIMVESLSGALVDQLDLDKNQGLVITKVMSDSAAAKAGLKVNDILLEVDGTAVSSNPAAFVKSLGAVKTNTPVTVVVLRKGKKEVIKGLSLPEADQKQKLGGFFPTPGFPEGGKGAPGFPGGGSGVGKGGTSPYTPGGMKGGSGGGMGGGFGSGFGGGSGMLGKGGTNPYFAGGFGAPGTTFSSSGSANGVMTTVFRTDDRFTARHQEGSLVISLTGVVSGNAAKVKEIHVQDGKESHEYQSLDKVPERYADKVKNLVEMAQSGSVKVKIKNKKSKGNKKIEEDEDLDPDK
jgi:membrane-associated protease RseP (regulator of RpoE activity)